MADCNGDNGDPKLRTLLDNAAASLHKWTADGQILVCGMLGYTDTKTIVLNNSFEFALEFATFTAEFGTKVLMDEMTARYDF